MPFLGGRRRMASALPTHQRMPGDFLLISYRNTVSMQSDQCLTPPANRADDMPPNLIARLHERAPSCLCQIASCAPRLTEPTRLASLGNVVRLNEGKTPR